MQTLRYNTLTSITSVSISDAQSGGLIYFDNFEISTFDGEDKIALDNVTGISASGEVLSWDDVDNAYAYAVRLYKNGLLFSTITTTGTSCELASEISRGGVGLYTVSVQAKGDYITYIHSDESTTIPATDYTVQTYFDDSEGLVAKTTVTKNNTAAVPNFKMIVAVYDNGMMVSGGIQVIDINNSLLTTGVPVTISSNTINTAEFNIPSVRIFIWDSLSEMKPITAVTANL